MKGTRTVAVLGEYAADQWGLVTSAQATHAGVDAPTLTRLAAAGTITPVVRGVYQLAGSPHARFVTEAAAWLRLDPAKPAWERDPLDPDGGVISHRSAALIHQIGDLLAPHVEFTIPRRRRTRDTTIRFHQAQLAPDEVTMVDWLPVTTVERTLADLFAEHLDGGHAADLLSDAFESHHIDNSRLAHYLAPFASRYGALRNDGQALIDLLTNREDTTPSAAASRTNAGELATALQRWKHLAAEAEAAVKNLQQFQAQHEKDAVT